MTELSDNPAPQYQHYGSGGIDPLACDPEGNLIYESPLELVTEIRRVARLLGDRNHEVAVLRQSLTEAVNYCTGRIGQIGASQVYTPQIDVRAAERWRRALSRETTTEETR